MKLTRFSILFGWVSIGFLSLINIPNLLAQGTPVPGLSSRVTDLTGSLKPGDVESLTRTLKLLEDKTTHQVAILLVPSTKGEPIESYALRVAESWKLGQKGKDNGILILLALQDRALRIEVGYGLEGDVPDVVARRIISRIMIPQLKANNLRGALEGGVGEIQKILMGEASIASEDEPVAAGPAPEMSNLELLLLAFYAIVAIVLSYTIGTIFTSLGFGVLGMLYGFFSHLIATGLSGAFTSALEMGALGFIITLVLILTVHTKLGGGGDSSGGSYSGGGFGGGFGGGGGSFGGGGSSGRW